MTAALVGVLTASVLGSAHCAAMCGGFVCFYAGSAPNDARLLRAHALYNVGRLASYLLLGAASGVVGSGVATLGAIAGIGHSASIVAGLLMVGWALTHIAALYGVRFTPATPRAWQSLVSRFVARFSSRPVGTRAALMGLATTLIPCGWLYVFVAAAGGTGSVTDAVLVMAVFWIGSVPALVAVGLGAQRLFGPLREKLPTLSAVTVLVIGLLAITGRLSLAAAAMNHGH